MLTLNRKKERYNGNMLHNKKGIRILLVLIAVIALISALSLISLYTAGVAGDVTQDGKLTGRDAVTLLKYCAGWSLDISEVRADVNADGKVNGKDAILLLKYLAGWNVKLKMRASEDLNNLADYSDEIKSNWKKAVLGNQDEKAVHSAEYLQRAKSYSDSAKYVWDAQKNDITFGYPIVYGESDAEYVTSYYTNICTLAKAYAIVGSELYHNEELFDDIIKGLDYGYDHYYGKEVMAWGTYGNWWEWDIGIPLQLTCTLLALEDRISAEDITKYLSCFDYLVASTPYSSSGCNRLWYSYCVMCAALLEGDGDRLVIAQKAMKKIFDYVETDDGFYTDGSFIQHGAYSNVGSYGLKLIISLPEIMLMFDGTPYEIEDEDINNQYKWILETFQPVNYNGNFFAATMGRCIGYFDENSCFNDFIKSLFSMTLYAPEEYKSSLISLLRTYMKSTGSDFTSVAPLQLVDYAKELYNDDSVPLIENRNIFKSFGMMERIVQQNEKYAVCLALSSTSIAKYENIGEQNITGWYQSDGALYLYTDNYSYSAAHVFNINPYRIAGTTVSTAQRTVESIGINSQIYNSSDVAGGASSGAYGVALFRLGYAENKYFASDIRANKSYFMFDNEIVCVGSDISESSGNSVETVIEDRLIRDGDTFTIEGENFDLTDTDTPVTAKYLHFSNMGGYVMTEETELNVRRNGSTYSFLEITQNHGECPVNAEYEYILLPEATEAETKDYSDNPDITVLTHEKNLHIVKENTLNTVGYAFYAAGTGYGVSANAPCAVFVTYEDDGRITVCISEITKNNNNLEVTLSLGSTVIESADKKFRTECDGSSVKVHLNGTVNQGKTFALTLK